MPFRTIAVLGSGAIGIYYGVRLGLGGADVRFLLRSDLEPVRRRGSLIVRIGGEVLELKEPKVGGSPGEIGPVDLVIVAWKTTANADLARALPPLLHEDTALLTLQNGLGSDEEIARLFGAARVMGGLAFIANNRVGPGEVHCYHPGSLSLGEFGRPPSERLQALAAQFNAAGVKTRIAENLVSARWHKLVWNVPFNGLSIAAGGVATDRLCAEPTLAAEVRALMREVQQAASALGCPISDAFAAQQFDVTPPMGAYRPSSLVDFQAGREVEVDAIWGEPLRRAAAAGVPTPRLALLHALLRALSTRS
jgi:2-dehydropantoate 2-reductase